MLQTFKYILAASLLGIAAPTFAKKSAFQETVIQIMNSPSDSEYQQNEIDLSELTSEQAHALQTWAKRESQVWWDTILEGDYVVASTPVQLQSIVAIANQRNELVAYKMTYGRKAWSTGSCPLNEEALEQISEGQEAPLTICQKGQIVGSSFVSPDFSEAARNYQDLEEFIQD